MREEERERLSWIMTRRSTRRFRETEVEEEKLDAVIEAGRSAPSGGNNQTTRFIVIRDRKILADLAHKVCDAFSVMEITEGMYRSKANAIRASKKGGYVFHYNAPVLITVANKRTYGNNMADCSCAQENMMIAANMLDLGTCWINQLHWLTEDPAIRETMQRLGLEEDEVICGSLAVGYADSVDGLPNRTALPRTGNPVHIW